MTMKRQKQSTNDGWRVDPYLRGIPVQELERAIIVRDKKTGNVQIIRNGLVTYDAIKRIGI